MNQYQNNKHAHSVGWNTFHFEWCTKYRYKVLKSEYIKNICLIAILEAGKRYKIDVMDAEADVDHVHVVAGLPMTMSPVDALNKMKGYTSKLILELVPNLRKRYPKGHLWSPGKFAGSVGHITLENAKKYLEDHHAKVISIKESLLVERSGTSCLKGNPLGQGGCQIYYYNPVINDIIRKY